MTNPLDNNYLDCEKAARLMSVDVRTVRRMVTDGRLAYATSIESAGRNGISYRIPLSSLPAEAQIRYYEECGRATAKPMEGFFDLAGYAEKAGADGVEKLLARQRAVLRLTGYRESGGTDLTGAIEQIAAEAGMSAMTLRRLETRYNEQGLAGLVRSGRSDKGESRTMCLGARQLVQDHWLNQNKLKANTILDMVIAEAAEMGASACANCPYNPESDAYAEAAEMDGREDYPACAEAGRGMIAPENRHSVNRVLSQIPNEVSDYARRGWKYWRDQYMMKGWRKKPDMVNKCWFGDHHRFDLFVLDENRKPVRPWLTVWYDIGSGMATGWVISTRPNSGTITEALVRGIADKPGSPIYGIPEYLYMDNGMDYRSKRFKGVDPEEADYRRRRDPEMIARMYMKLYDSSVVQALGIQVTYAQTYYGQAKPVERWFKTIEERYCRQLPGYCGGMPKDRPEDFEHMLKALMEKGELMTLDELADTFENQILPAYNEHPHQGYGGETPAARYARLPKARAEHVSWSVLSAVRELKAERKATPQGIWFRKQLYWSTELLHMANQRVILRYSECTIDSVSVYDTEGRFICIAEAREGFEYVGEDPEKIAAHIAVQKRHHSEVRQRIRTLSGRDPGKKAKGNMYFPAVDEDSKGNITSFEAEQMQRRKRDRKRPKDEDDWSIVDEFFLNGGAVK